MSTQSVLRVVSRVTGRVRFWRMMEAFVPAALWALVVLLPLYVADMFVAVPWYLLLAPVAGFIVLFILFAAKRLRGVNRFEVAKIVDDQMQLKDRLTSALYFERLKFDDDMSRAAMAEADEVASKLDLGKLALGTWPKRTALVGGLVAVTIVLAIGPMHIRGWFGSATAGKTAAAKKTHELADEGAAPTDNAPAPLEKIDNKKPIQSLTKIESERAPDRDPNSMDTSMSADVLADIEAVKATVNMQDMKDMQDAFKDDKDKPKEKDKSDTKPPPIAPLDQELLNDIARATKTKSEKSEGGKDDAIGVAVKMPSKPGAKSQGQPKKGGGGHGGGDVGESGDTRGAPRRVPIPGREKLVVDSRKSNDTVEKTDFEKTVMTEVMMRLSMKDVEMTAKAVDVPTHFSPQAREPVAEETIPPGLRGYVQRYFEGLAPRQAPQAPAEGGTEKPTE